MLLSLSVQPDWISVLTSCQVCSVKRVGPGHSLLRVGSRQGGSHQHKSLSTLIISKWAWVLSSWVESRRLQPFYLHQHVSQQLRGFSKTSFLQIPPGVLILMIFLFFFLSTWLHGDVSCSFDCIGNQFPGSFLWELFHMWMHFLYFCQRAELHVLLLSHFDPPPDLLFSCYLWLFTSIV